MNKNINAVMICKNRFLYEPENTYHEVNLLKTILKDRYYNFNLIPNDRYNKIKEANRLDIKFENGEFETYEQWIERHDERYLLWNIFIELLKVYENLPDYEVVKNELSHSWWDFRNVAQGFRFGLQDKVDENYILSMNVCYSNSNKYLGTLDEFIEKFNTIPYQCIFIANNMTPEQQLKLNKILSKHEAFNDGQGGWGSLSNVYWKVIYV